jgi:hypothetical protein
VSLPATPVEAYKAMIDHFVNEVRVHGRGALLKKRGEMYGSDERFNAFARTLSAEQREVLSDLLQAERDGTIHDLLANFTWWITTRNVGLTYNGQPMPAEVGDMGMHGDYVSRREGWPWPE